MTLERDYPLEVVRPDAEFTLYRDRHGDGSSVLALVINRRQPARRSLERLEHEYALAADLAAPWAIHPLALTSQEGRPALLLEDPGGQPLDRILDGAPLDLTTVLRLASDLAGALGQVHRQGLVHKDLKPAHVFVDASGAVRITGFGIASRLRSERQAPGPPELIAGTLPYMAPEQTGRMNRSIDARSDLYALGVTLFEMLTGTLPFSATDPLELIHAHLARQPPSPGERVPGLPPMLDAVVAKLLAKNPEDRYRTATGAEADLRRCLAAWSEHGAIEPFELATADVSDRLLIPERLYGRDIEVEALRRALERVVAGGRVELILVSGQAGIGKSSLVNELHRSLVARRGLFASGKFDQYRRGVPYATIAQAFRGLVRQLLGKSDEELARWREALLGALEPYGQLMVTLVPELELVIGEQPPVPQTDPQSSQARFYKVFRALTGVFATAEHPLVLFIDDLQWLDSGTLELLERLTADPEIRYLLLIGAYRDDEVTHSHPLAKTLGAINAAGVPISELRLEPLQVDHLAQLSADALDTDVGRARPLAELVGEKTAGNPFFAVQFFRTLADEGLLFLDPTEARWTWDIDRIQAKRITENVAQLLSAKLSRLSPGTRAAVGQLACLGNAADSRTLALVRGGGPEEVQEVLREAVEAGLILHSEGSFAFMHDRVHEAAYELIPAGQRSAAHLHIGRVLLSLTEPSELVEKVFEIVNQFQRGASAIEAPAERDLVAELNLVAGKRAMASSAHALALGFFAAGLRFLGRGRWEDRYRLAFDLERNCAECEIVVADMAAAEERLAAIAPHAAELADQADVVCLMVLLYFSTGRSDRAVEVALGFLPRVGIAWAASPSEAEVRAEYERMRRNLTQRPIDALRAMPPMRDPVSLVAMSVLMELFPAAYAVDRYLMEMVLLRMTNLSLEQGNCESSAVAYSALNMAVGFHFADYTTAYSLGRLACEMVEQRGADRYRARVYSCFAAFTMPWSKHLPLCKPLMTHAFQVGSSTGDMAFAAYDARNLITHLLVSGVPLAQVQREAEQATEFAKRIQLGLEAEQFIGQLRLVRNLRGVTQEDRPGDEEWARQDVADQPGLAMMVCYYWVFRLQARYLAGDLAAALEAADRVAGIRWAMRSSIEEADYDFFAALARASACDRARPAERDDHARALAEHYERLVAWADSCPENFANRRALVGAEIARVEGRGMEAQALYESAVQLARRYGFVQNEALANELAGRFHASLGLETIADAYLRNAREGYERWGGVAKVRQLDARYPELRTGRSSRASTTSIDAPIVHLDVEVVDKASQTLSSEIDLPSLLEKLMRLAVEHAGAQRGVLVLLHGTEPQIEAEATTGRGAVEVAVRGTPVRASDLPLSALQFVLRARERVVLDDATADGLDPLDEYVRLHRPKSVLCLPIFKETEVIGALYLENNLTTRAFTPDRVAVLDFLGSQAAIWLENARLYSDLRRSEAWLREAQHLSSTGSWYWRVDLDTVEFSEQTSRIYELEHGVAVTLEMIASRIHPEDMPLLREMIDIARGPASDLDYLYRARMPDGTVKHLHLVAHGSRGRDGRLEYIGAIQDVTQRHLAEEALGKARAELAHVTRVTTLGAMTASIAHEVSQPLSGIVTNSSTCLRMLSGDPPNVEGAKETVRRTIRDGHRASEVITRLRAMFGNKSAVDEPVDLNDAAREVIALSGNELQSSRIVPRTELAAELPLVRGDRVQLQQVILNLILNAADAMSGAEDHARELVIRTEVEEGERVRLSVQDSGVGLDPEAMERLFEAFYTTKRNGMGMGLSVSRSIIEGHRGRIWAEPNPGKGATFLFSIPRAPEAESTAADPDTVPRSGGAPYEHSSLEM